MEPDDDFGALARNRKRKRARDDEPQSDSDENDADRLADDNNRDFDAECSILDNSIDLFRTPPPKRAKIHSFESLGKLTFAKNTREENRTISREFKSVELEEQLLNAELESLYSPPPQSRQAAPATPVSPAIVPTTSSSASPSSPYVPAQSSKEQAQQDKFEFTDTSQQAFLDSNTMPTLMGRILRGETFMTAQSLVDYFVRVRNAAGSGHSDMSAKPTQPQEATNPS